MQQKGYLADAAAEFRRALTLQPDLAEAHNDLGLTFMAEGAAEDAIPEFQAALKTDPQ